MAFLNSIRRFKNVANIRRLQSLVDVKGEKNIQSRNLKVFLADQLKPKIKVKDLPFGKVMTDHMLQIEWDKEHGWGTPVIKPHEVFQLHPAAGVLQYGGQIYEGMKGFYGVDKKIRVFRPSCNVARFNISARRMALPTFNENELLRCILELVEIEKDWVPKEDGCSLYIRPSLISLDTVSADQDINKALLFVILSPVGSYFKGDSMQPVSLLAEPSYVRAWPGGLGECKAGGNYGSTVFLQKEAEKKGYNQILWLFNDEVTEAGTMNIFMHWENENGEEELITAPLDGLILRGITRKSFLELARKWDEFLVSERTFTMKDVVKALKENRIKGIFAAGTACVVCPIGKILYKNQLLEIPCTESDGMLAPRFYKSLLDIQYGRTPHEWAPIIC
ncbi:branched-chain-amino-acid aminotransferase, mitochondrial-like [Hydractinia symbiolongicarpus]|uniref:branched-chain-amino-acid aminotransferase, mitochondrial-like n=1 Tax=Hydractinia symbiolongicarpus TaxID=13093 RepID=UPI00254F8762|nr:branched-chain-amino-acid aminotransferase, mitochondrial-like [Hydractinia symbiolongicarpus]